MGRIAVSGASGRTGWRIVEEARRRGLQVTALVRPSSTLPPALAEADVVRLELTDLQALTEALRGCDVLVIATGARPSIDLLGPLKVDALAIPPQIAAAKAAGVERLVLVTSLCSGRWLHPLNLFGLILVWKGLAERWLAESGLRWTVVRPGGLRESEEAMEEEGIVFSEPGEQESDSIPRRLVARVCLDALDTPAAVGRIIEVTSRRGAPAAPLAAWLEA